MTPHHPQGEKVALSKREQSVLTQFKDKHGTNLHDAELPLHDRMIEAETLPWRALLNNSSNLDPNQNTSGSSGSTSIQHSLSPRRNVSSRLYQETLYSLKAPTLWLRHVERLEIKEASILTQIQVQNIKYAVLFGLTLTG